MTDHLSQKSPRKAKPSFLYAMLSIALVLFLVGLIGLGYYYSNKTLNSIKESVELDLILFTDIDKVEVSNIKAYLDSAPFVVTSEFKSKEDAAKEFQREIGQEFVDLAGFNPLFDSYIVHLKSNYTNTDSVKYVLGQLKKLPGVEDVTYSEEVMQLVSQHISQAYYIVGGLSILLLIIAFSLIDNTIRLMMFSQRFLIRSMQLIGATKMFIMKPFIKRSLLSGFLSSLMAILCLGGLIYLLWYRFNVKIEQNDLIIFGIIGGSLILFGIIISLISTYFSVNKYLGMKLEELY